MKSLYYWLGLLGLSLTSVLYNHNVEIVQASSGVQKIHYTVEDEYLASTTLDVSHWNEYRHSPASVVRIVKWCRNKKDRRSKFPDGFDKCCTDYERLYAKLLREHKIQPIDTQTYYKRDEHIK